MVVATDTGKTARRALELFPRPPFRVIAVSNPPGIDLPVESLHDYLPRFKEHRRALEERGIKSVPASLSASAQAALEQQGARVLRVDWPAVAELTQADLSALDRIGVGTRVGVTIALVAYLSGAVVADTEICTISGTGFGGGGADTALVLRSAAAWPDWRVLEIIARPRVSPPSEV